MFLLAFVVAFLALVAPANAQLVPCESQLATAGGTAWTCPLGGIRNVVDIEGGTVHYENGQLDRGKLRLNLSGGEADGVREAIALNPDLGGCTLIYNGRRTLIGSFCPQSFPSPDIRFFAPLYLCQPGCLDVGQRLLQQQVKTAAVERRLARTNRRFLRLHRQVVALRKLVENGGRRKLR